jgi:hypothetical protein
MASLKWFSIACATRHGPILYVGLCFKAQNAAPVASLPLPAMGHCRESLAGEHGKSLKVLRVLH